MTILNKWQHLSQMVCDLAVDHASYPNESSFFMDAFAVNKEELPFLCLLQQNKFINISAILPFVSEQTKQENINKALDKLHWLGWICSGNASHSELLYNSSAQFQERLQLWENKTWEETPSGLKPDYPSEEDMIFPMKKEVYQRKLEKICDDLQQEQLLYFQGELYLDELEEDDKLSLARQKEFIFKLQELYKAWSEYVPKYYSEK